MARLTVQSGLQKELMSSGIEVWVQRDRGQLSFLEARSELLVEIREGQSSCPEIVALKERMAQGRALELSERADGMMMFQSRVVVPSTSDLRRRIMHEAHTTPYSIHPGTAKMYQDLKRSFWWQRMKADIIGCVA